jgi:hypothetical protein
VIPDADAMRVDRYRDRVATPMLPAGQKRTGPTHPWRWVIVGVVVIVVLNLAIFGLDSSDTAPEGRTLPSTIDSVTPAPGELIRLQDTVGAVLRDDLTGVLVLDGVEIPEDQLERVVPLAVVTFRPGTDQDLESFEAGEHTLTVLYWEQGKPRPGKPGAYSWSFRAGA